MTDSQTAQATNPFLKKTGKGAKAAAAEAQTEAAQAQTEPTEQPQAAPQQAAPQPSMPMPGGAQQASGSGLPMPGAAPMPGAGGLPTVGQPQTQAGSQGPMPGGANAYANPNGSGDLAADFVIDLTDVQQGGRDFIGAGRHLMYCEGVTTGFAKSGKRKLVYSYVVASGEYEGKKAQAHVAIQDNQMWKHDEHCRALGITNDDARKPTVGDIQGKSKGVLVVGEFVPSTYNNRPTTDFARVYPPDEVGIRTGTTIDMARRGEGVA